MSEVLITGSHCACNKGGAALVIAAARGMRRRLGADTLVTVTSPFPRIDAAAYAPHGLEVIPSHRRRLWLCALHATQSWCLGRPPLALTEEVRATRRAHLVLDVSGDGFSEDYGPPVVLSHLYPIWLAIRYGKPVCLAAQTLGPYPTTRRWVRRLFNQVSLITARDEFSMRTLAEMKVRGPQIEPAADLAFLLDAAQGPPVDQRVALAPNGFWSRPVLGLTISQLGGQRSSLGRSLPKDVFFAAYAEAVADTARQIGCSVLLVAHRTGPLPRHDDRPLTRRLRDRLSASLPGRVWMLDEDAEATALKGVIGRCSWFCAQRLHSGIASLSQAIPTLMIGCAPKAREMMRQLGMESFLLPLEAFSAPALRDRLQQLWAARLEIRDQLRGRLPLLRQAAERTLDLAADRVERAAALRVE